MIKRLGSFIFIIMSTFSLLFSQETPTSQASLILFSQVQDVTMRIEWRRGNGSKCAVFLKEGIIFNNTATPSTNTTYIASTAFGNDDSQIFDNENNATGWYCIYNGVETEVNVSNLSRFTYYTAMVCEYNGDEGSEKYNTSSAPLNPAYSSETLPVELVNFTATNESGKIKLFWETATEVNNYGFEVERTIQNSELEIKNWETIGFVPGHGNSNSPKFYEYLDNVDLLSADSLIYRLKQIDTDGKFEYFWLTAKVGISNITDIKQQNLVSEFNLEQNYPNPFNPTTTISYRIPKNSFVSLKVYNLLGKEVATLVQQSQTAGSYNYSFNASNFSSGTYIYRINVGNYSESKKLTLIK